MFLSKVKFVALILLALAVVGSGAGFLAQHTKAEPPLPKPVPVADKAKTKEAKPKTKADPTKMSEEMTTLLKARVAVAEKVYRAAFELLGQTRRVGNVLTLITEKPEEVYIWSLRWLQAQRDLSIKHEDQVAALEAHLQRMTELKKKFEELSRDLVPNVRVDEAEWYRLEAELWLMRAKAAK